MKLRLEDTSIMKQLQCKLIRRRNEQTNGENKNKYFDY